jgi:hypothetical protein
MPKSKSLIKNTWASLELSENGYDHVLNVSTNLVLDPAAKDYDSQKITALVDEVKLLLDRYDRANIVNAKTAK